MSQISLSTTQTNNNSKRHANSTISQNFKQIMSVLILILLAQVSGINVLTFFTNELFHQESSSQLINPDTGIVLLSSIQVIGGLPTSIFVDKFGRKILLLSSLFAMSVSLGVLSAYYYITDYYLDFNDFMPNYPMNQKILNLVPLIFLATYSVSYSWGVGSVTWILLSEMIPSKLIGLHFSGKKCTFVIDIFTKKCFFFKILAPVSSIANILYWLSLVLCRPSICRNQRLGGIFLLSGVRLAIQLQPYAFMQFITTKMQFSTTIWRKQ